MSVLSRRPPPQRDNGTDGRTDRQTYRQTAVRCWGGMHNKKKAVFITCRFDFVNLLSKIRFKQHRFETMVVSGYSRYLGNQHKQYTSMPARTM